jgi:hypothetical protein
MKLSRYQLRKLITEALKPFFMGVEPSDLLDRLRNDPELDSSIKQLLNNPNSAIQRTGLELVSYEPGMTEKYPELDSDEFYLDSDFVDRSKPAYQKEFQSAQQRAEDIALRQNMLNTGSFEKMDLVRKVAQSAFTTVFFKEGIQTGGTKMIVLRAQGPQDTGPMKHFDKAETERFMKRIENLGLMNSIYIQQSHQIIFMFDDQ